MKHDKESLKTKKFAWREELPIDSQKSNLKPPSGIIHRLISKVGFWWLCWLPSASLCLAPDARIFVPTFSKPNLFWTFFSFLVIRIWPFDQKDHENKVVPHFPVPHLTKACFKIFEGNDCYSSRKKCLLQITSPCDLTVFATTFSQVLPTPPPPHAVGPSLSRCPKSLQVFENKTFLNVFFVAKVF